MSKKTAYEWVEEECNRFDPQEGIPVCHFDVMCLKRESLRRFICAMRNGEIIAPTCNKQDRVAKQ